MRSFELAALLSNMQKRILKGLFAIMAISVLTILGLVAGLRLTGNIHPVNGTSAFRSGQLSTGQFERFVTEHGIKTVINLRGDAPDEHWYQEETLTSRRLDIEHVDLKLSANREPDDQTIKRLIRLMRRSAPPILIHCEAGADRSGLAAALYRLAISHDQPGIAEKQLSIFYGHFPWLWSHTGAMDRAFRHVVDAPEQFLDDND